MTKPKSPDALTMTWPALGTVRLTVRTTTLVFSGRLMVPVVSPLDARRGNATDSFCGVMLPSATFAVVTAPGANCAAVMLPGVR